MTKTLMLHGLVLAALIALAGCAPQSPQPESPLDSPFPSPLSPISAPKDLSVVPIQLDRPIKAGTTEITGSGPAGVPIILQDITFGGTELGRTTINSSGKFEFHLGRPLETRHRIGIALGDLTATTWERQDFANDGYHGPEAFSVPQIGFFFDTFMIRE